MKHIVVVIILIIFTIHVSGQTHISVIINNQEQHKIDRVEVSDLSKTYDTSYHDTLTLTFYSGSINSYYINYYENDKQFRQEIWLDTGNIEIKAHFSKTALVIDTVLNSPIYYKVQKYFDNWPDVTNIKDTNAANRFFIDAYMDNADNLFSLVVARTYSWINQNSKSNLINLKALLETYGNRLSKDPMYTSLIDRLTKTLEISRINLSDFAFMDTEGKEAKPHRSGSNYYILDLWFLECPPCVADHKKLKADYEKLKREKIEMIGISQNEDVTAWKSYLTTHNYNWQNYMESPANNISTYLSVSTFPTYIILNSRGTIMRTYNSFADVKKYFKIN